MYLLQVPLNPPKNDWDLYHEIIKGAISGCSGILLLALTWVFGQKLTFQWNIRQKQRELQMAALQQFYSAYGEFFAVWKVWNRLEKTSEHFNERRWEMLKRRLRQKL
jgi:hypothetical protein